MQMEGAFPTDGPAALTLPGGAAATAAAARAAAAATLPTAELPFAGPLRSGGARESFLHAILVAAVLSPASYAFGQAARQLRLPQITGYLVSGVVCGPYGLGILSASGVSSLSVIEGACLGVIGLAAGAELHLSELAKSKRAVVSVTLGICAATWAAVYAALIFAAPIAPPASLVARALAASADSGRSLTAAIAGGPAEELSSAAAALMGAKAAGGGSSGVSGLTAAVIVASPSPAVAVTGAAAAAAAAKEALAAATLNRTAAAGRLAAATTTARLAAAAAGAAAAAAGAGAGGAAGAAAAAVAAGAAAAAAAGAGGEANGPAAELAAAAAAALAAEDAQTVAARRLAVAVASLGATLMMARSPASAIAVLKEMDGRGPFSSLVMGVTVLKDVIVLLAFACNIQLVPAILGLNSGSGSGGGGVFGALSAPLASLAASLATGVVGGYLLSVALEHKVPPRLGAAARRMLALRPNPQNASPVLPPLLPGSGIAAAGQPGAAAGGGPRPLDARAALVLAAGAGIFQAARWVGAEPLLACVAAGALAANRRPSAAAGTGGHDAASPGDVGPLVETVMYWTNVAFFGLAGASLKLGALAGTLWAAALVVAARLLAIAAGSWAGCRAGGVREAHRRVFWLSQITQAGVALGLSRIAGTAFPDWGPAFQALMTGVICCNMALGPPCFRLALIRVGEARTVGLPLKHSSALPLSDSDTNLASSPHTLHARGARVASGTAGGAAGGVAALATRRKHGGGGGGDSDSGSDDGGGGVADGTANGGGAGHAAVS